MKSMNTIIRKSILILGLAIFPIVSKACGMSAIGSGAIVEAMLIIAIVIFLLGYVPYLVFSIKLAKQSSNIEGTNKATKILASIFATVNTLVFLSAVYFIATEGGGFLFIGDVLLWGIPFAFFLKGIGVIKGKM